MLSEYAQHKESCHFCPRSSLSFGFSQKASIRRGPGEHPQRNENSTGPVVKGKDYRVGRRFFMSRCHGIPTINACHDLAAAFAAVFVLYTWYTERWTCIAISKGATSSARIKNRGDCLNFHSRAGHFIETLNLGISIPSCRGFTVAIRSIGTPLYVLFIL